MSIENLQRAAEAAGFATASDDNQDAPNRSARPRQATALSYPASLLAAARPLLPEMPAAPAAIWSRANLGQFIPAWAAKA
jgi:hypothetical protein